MAKKKTTNALALIEQDDLEKQVAEAVAAHEKVAQEFHLLGKKVTKLSEQREALECELARRETAKIDPASWREFTQAQWEYVLHTDWRGNAERYKLADRVANEMGVSFSGYNPQTEQRSIQLRMYRDEANMVQGTLEWLNIVLPHLKPSKLEFRESDSYSSEEMEVEAIYLSIIDKGLSEYAVYFALVNVETGVYWAMQTRYSRTTRNKKFETLEELVTYLNTTHYYQKLKGCYESDYDEDDN